MTGFTTAETTRKALSSTHQSIRLGIAGIRFADLVVQQSQPVDQGLPKPKSLFSSHYLEPLESVRFELSQGMQAEYQLSLIHI